MSATSSFSFTSTALDGASSTSLSLPPRPPPPPFDDDDDESDDESDFGDDDHDHEESHHSSSSPLSSYDTLSSVQSSAVPSVSASTTFATSTTTSILEVNPTISTASPAKTAQSFDSGNIDSIPQNEADPVIESRIMSSPLGTAGIVLVAIFGFIALVTTFYFFFRLKRRRRGEGHDRNGLQRSNTSDSTVSLEKGLASNWASTTQETGIIFGRQSAASSGRSRAETRGRGRFSFLNRRWYSTGTEATAAQAQYNASPPPSPPRWGASLFGMGFRSQSATPRSQSVSTSVLEAPYTSQAPDTVDILSSEIQRTFSQRSGESGEGHARAYAHHNVRAPRSVARSTVSSLSSRLLRRRERGQDRTLPLTPTRSVSETSDMYGGSRRASVNSEKQIRHSRESSAIPPRIPLRVAVSEDRRITRQSL